MGSSMENDIVAQGLELMLYGMGTVVVFLGLLIVVTGAMSTLITRFFPEPQAPVLVPSIGSKGGPAAPADGEVVAVISAAIAQHRNRKNKA